jgi:leader peptidase (prepilin peptidase) / N-methyltransferase
MTFDAGHLLAALVSALACGVLATLVPPLVRRLPEPVPETVAETGDAEEGHTDGEADAVVPAATRTLPAAPPKEPYVAIAALPGLAWKSALAGGACGGLVGLAVGWSAVLPALVFLVPVAVALAVIDWRTTLLPTRIIAPSYVVLAALCLLAALLGHDWHLLVRAALGWLVAGGLFFGLWFVYPKGLGYGDVRLSGLLGLALGLLGWPQLLVGVYTGFLLGGVGGLLLAALRIVNRKRFPFGPFMLVGALAGILAGPWITAGLGY